MNFPTQPDPQFGQQPQMQDEEIFNLRTAVSVVLDYWPLAVGLFALGILTGLYKAWVTPPVYESSALVEVESQNSGFAVGPESLSSSPYWMPQTITAQIEILKSRRILGEAAEQMGLTMSAEPRYMGDINATMARRYSGEGLASAPWYIPGSGKYAWGGERIELAGFHLPEAMLGQTFILVAQENGAYSLRDEEGAELGHGTTGTELSVATPGGSEIRLNVAKLVARPGTEFSLQRLTAKDAADSLRGRLRVSERGAKGAFTGSGILDIAVRAPTAREAADSANAISSTYLRQNVERLSQGAERKLEFLNSQLPRLQQELETAEQALLEQRSKNGPFQLSDGAKSILDSLTVIERQVSELDLQRAELSQTLTVQHPAMAAVDRKLDQLRNERARINAQIATLPDAESRQLQLMRNSKVSGELYISLLNKAQELKVAKAGTIGNVRIVDTAAPEHKPVEPKVQRILLSWSALGLIAGLAAVFLRKHLNVKLEWAEDAERRIGLPVYATVPFSSREQELDSKAPRASSRRLLAEEDPQDIAVESLRSLRASLHFAMMDAKRNLVVITGSTPNVGKSFIAANLAKLVADSDRKVLLIDADLRKGRMHKMLGFERSPGLSELVAGQATMAQVLRQVGDDDKFWAITTGKLPPNPAELLASEHFIDLVENTCKQFDIVIVDTPPVLNLADGVLVARSAGAVFVTVRGGQSTVPDVLDCVQRFAKNGIKVDGLIFNAMRFSIGSYVHPTYYHYRYRYSRYGGKAKA